MGMASYQGLAERERPRAVPCLDVGPRRSASLYIIPAAIDFIDVHPVRNQVYNMARSCRSVALALASYLGFFITVQSTLAADPLVKSGDRIVFLGDSITEAGAQPGGYVTLVRETLAHAHPDLKVEILGAGISGNRVPDIEKRLEADVLSKKPTLVVIYIGINDVWHSQFGKGTPKAEFSEGLKRIIKSIQDSGAKVVLCTPSVIGEKHDGTNSLDAMLEEYSAVSRAVARESNAGLLDLRKRFLASLRTGNEKNAEKEVLTTDGVHLNAAGNRFVADQMIAALQGQLDGARLLRHVVLFQFKADTGAAQVQEVADAFEALPRKITEIHAFERGTNVSPENLAQGFTHCFVVTFTSEQNRDTYLKHAIHEEFVKLAVPRIEKVLVVDYWTE